MTWNTLFAIRLDLTAPTESRRRRPMRAPSWTFSRFKPWASTLESGGAQITWVYLVPVVINVLARQFHGMESRTVPRIELLLASFSKLISTNLQPTPNIPLSKLPKFNVFNNDNLRERAVIGWPPWSNCKILRATGLVYPLARLSHALDDPAHNRPSHASRGHAREQSHGHRHRTVRDVHRKRAELITIIGTEN